MTRRQTVLLLLLASIWGGSYALIKVALDDGVPWAWVAFIRIGVGALIITALAVRQVGVAAICDRLRWTAPIGAAQIAVPFLLISWGERRLPSGLAGVLVATAPLFTALLAVRFVPDTALGRRGLVGVGIGFVGVVLLFGADLSGSGGLVVAGLALVLAALGYGVGSTLSRRKLAGMPPLAVSASTLLWSTAMTGAVALPSAAPPSPSGGAIVALLVLGAVGTGLAYLIFFTLVSEVGPSRTMLVTYLAPVFAVGYGAAFLDEAITAGVVLGIVLVIGGSVIGSRSAGAGRAPRPARPPRTPLP
ncbi:DMT family transporter [Patulibacter americanus]|uniref:DMT family transporter n=1 Tax=Patulibacter americanus TaxID=588672 RepID=UPI0003B770B2|nr:DMT family transporter [Patulibacter americanus]